MLSLTHLKVFCLSCFSFIKACFTNAKKCISSKILSCIGKGFQINSCTVINSNMWLSTLYRIRKGVDLLIYWDLWAVCLYIVDLGVSLSNSRNVHPLSTAQTWVWHWESRVFFFFVILQMQILIIFFSNKTKTKSRCRNSSFPWCSKYISCVTAMTKIW